jgi:hypothetical protein
MGGLTWLFGYRIHVCFSSAVKTAELEAVEEFYFQGCNAVYSIIFLDLGVFVTSL